MFALPSSSTSEWTGVKLSTLLMNEMVQLEDGDQEEELQRSYGEHE